jgi:hypothetical protein
MEQGNLSDIKSSSPDKSKGKERRPRDAKKRKQKKKEKELKKPRDNQDDKKEEKFPSLSSSKQAISLNKPRETESSPKTSVVLNDNGDEKRNIRDSRDDTSKKEKRVNPSSRSRPEKSGNRSEKSGNRPEKSGNRSEKFDDRHEKSGNRFEKSSTSVTQGPSSSNVSASPIVVMRRPAIASTPGPSNPVTTLSYVSSNLKP